MECSRELAFQSKMAPTGIVRDWKLVQALDTDGNHVPVPQEKPIVMTFTKVNNDATFSMSMKVANTTRGQVTVLPNGEAQIGPLMSTRIIGPPKLMAIETCFSKSMPNINRIKQEGDSLTFFIRGQTSSVWTSYTKPPSDPLTKDT